MRYPEYRAVLSDLGMSSAQLDNLISCFRPSSFDKDKTILNIGDKFDEVLILSRGAVRCYYLTPEGDESNKLFFFEDNIVFPVAPIARNQPSMFGIVTCESSLILRMSFTEFKQYLVAMNIWQPFYLTYLEWLVDSKVQREYRLLTLNKNQLIQNTIENESQVINRINDYHIASYLGMSPVTYSRLKPHS